MELNTFISRLFEAAQAAGIAPAEAACTQSDSFRVRVRRGELARQIKPRVRQLAPLQQLLALFKIRADKIARLQLHEVKMRHRAVLRQAVQKRAAQPQRARSLPADAAVDPENVFHCTPSIVSSR